MSNFIELIGQIKANNILYYTVLSLRCLTDL